MIKAGHLTENLHHKDDRSTMYYLNHTIGRTKLWLMQDGELDQLAKKNIEYYLEMNNITEITADNVMKKLEEDRSKTTHSNLFKSDESLVYRDLLDLLSRLTDLKTLKTHSLKAIISNSNSLTYDGHTVTDNDRKLILHFLDVLFKNR